MPAVKAESINSKLKRFSRNMLRGRWNKAVFVSLFLISAQLVSGTIESQFDLNGTRAAFYMSLGITAILELFLGVLTTGARNFFLKMARGGDFSNRDLFTPFKVQPDRYFVVELFKLVITVVIYSPCITASILMDQNPRAYFILFHVWSLIGTLILISFRLSICMAPYLLLDHEELGALDALKQSILLMQGKKFRMFRCFFSLIGYVILTVCTLGLGVLWLIPYSIALTGEYYRYLIGEIE